MSRVVAIHPLRVLLLAVALSVTLVPATPSAAAAAGADTPLTMSQARDMIEQAVVTMHHDARQRPTRWYAGAEQPASAPLLAWDDMQPSLRAWSRQQAEGVCPAGQRICHNVPPLGAGFWQEICCARASGENISMRWVSGTTITAADAESFARSMTSGLMASEGHRTNIMNPRYDDFSVGVHVWQADGGTYAIATFVFRERASTPPGAPLPDWGHTYHEGMASDGSRLAEAERPAVVLRSTETACPPAHTPIGVFADLGSSATPASRAIDCAAHRGVASGYGDGTFRPGVTLTRAHAASFIARLLDGLEVDLPAPTRGFPDVPPSHAHHDTIGRLVALDVVHGYGDGSFQPERRVTREQYLTMVDRALGHVDVRYTRAVDERFFLDVAAVHQAAADRLASRGIAAGPRRGILEGGAVLTRGEAAGVSARALDASVADGFGRRG